MVRMNSGHHPSQSLPRAIPKKKKKKKKKHSIPKKSKNFNTFILPDKHLAAGVVQATSRPEGGGRKVIYFPSIFKAHLVSMVGTDTQ